MTKRYSGQVRLRMPTSLHKELSELAAKEKVSLNTYVLYLLSKGIGKELKSFPIEISDAEDLLFFEEGETEYVSISPLQYVNTHYREN